MSPDVTPSRSPPPPPAEKRCLHCHAANVKQRCGGCRRVYFCDRDCQVRVWRHHRPFCSLDPSPSSVATATATAAGAPAAAPSAANAGAAADAAPPSRPLSAPVPPVASALHTKRASSPKTVRLVTEPMQALELPATAQRHFEEQEVAAAAAALAPSAAKKKKSRHKKKKRSNSMHTPASAPFVVPELKNRSVSLSVRKHIMWGDVSAREFTRFPGGGGAVPYDGTWALGLGTAVADVQLGSVLDVEQLRAQELQSRIQELPKSKRGHAREGETRQFDYCRGVENPLFARLSERERKQLFTEPHGDDVIDESQRPLHVKRKSSLSSTTLSPKQSPRLHPRKLSRSLSDAGSEGDALEAPDFACVSVEQLDEFAKIRDSRDAACGCACGDLVKKVAKMHVKRLHAFLAERGVATAGLSKPELLARAKEVAAAEKNCANAESCECARNGVECHSNVCDGCAGACWNPFKAYVYNKAEVGEYRKQQIAKWREANTKPMSPKDAAGHQQAIAVV
ncbi:hypothetical protein PybrP1_000963 [[Pythium] brassicae (nom. inval.)]|nr:hypothetical protein PybrP1_000963 [[Pythium] brassicae (nom. inval.)]